MNGNSGVVQRFLALESASGLVLVAMMVVALAWANSPLAPFYESLFAVPVVVGVGDAVLAKPLLLWINDGLMAVFFLLVALEIKREILEGELSTPAQVLLPTVAAIGGMAVPVGLYLALAAGEPGAARGWAIGSATDIAFSLGVLAVLGRAAPVGLKVFLTALAIIDDLEAIVVIGLFYATDLSGPFLALAAAAALVLLVLNRAGVTRLLPYGVVGALLWLFMLKSGVHATIAGVVLGLSIPLRGAGEGGAAPLRRLEHALHPWVAFGIMPLFALANAGLSFAGMQAGMLTRPVFLGVALGLFVGKQAGVFLFSWAAIRLGLGRLPAGVGWAQLYGVAVLAGIGFTMSLFIAGLAFDSGTHAAEARLGILTGSAASAVVGWAVLKVAAGRGQNPRSKSFGARR